MRRRGRRGRPRWPPWIRRGWSSWDETATPTSLTRLRARAPRGQRAVGTVPRRRWQSVSLLASLTPSGMGAAAVLDGAVNREAFDAYVEQLLLPTLRPGQIVILDNLAVHKSPRARTLIEERGVPAALPAPLLARFQSHRTGLRQDQADLARGGRADLRSASSPPPGPRSRPSPPPTPATSSPIAATTSPVNCYERRSSRRPPRIVGPRHALAAPRPEFPSALASPPSPAPPAGPAHPHRPCPQCLTLRLPFREPVLFDAAAVAFTPRGRDVSFAPTRARQRRAPPGPPAAFRRHIRGDSGPTTRRGHGWRRCAAGPGL